MKEKVLTISIASYNVESCLSKAVDSIVNCRNLDNIEVLIVNDGSKDKTAEIGRDYENRYPESVRLIDKKNGGHGSTINSGIENASGKYYRSLDADDWVVTESLDRLVERLQQTDVDMVLCGYNECIGEKTILMEDFKRLKDDTIYQLSDIVHSIKWMCYHSLVYKTKILQENKIAIDEKCFYVDNEYAIYPLPFINTVLYFSEPVYCYRIGVEEQSISPTSRMKHIRDSEIVSYHVLERINCLTDSVDTSLINYLYWNTSRICGWHFCSLLYFAPDNDKRRELESFDKEIFRTNKQIYDGMLSYFRETKSPYYLPMKILRGTGYKLYNMYGRLRHLVKRA